MDLKKIKSEKPILELLGFSILNIDKPSDWTSFDVVNYLRKIFSEFGIDKAGHLGTLDPMVTGVLPIVIGKACKIQEYFMHRDKVYIGKMQIHKQITEKKLKEEMKKFLGVIEQLPPRISRVKRVLRKRKVSQFELIDYDEKTRIAEFISYVEAGTYIRKLIDDLGKNIGGANMIELRRTRAGLFSDKDKEFCKIEDVQNAIKEFKEQKNEEKLRKLLIPAEVITNLIETVEVNEESVEKLKNGSPLFEEMLENPGNAVKTIEKKEPFAVVSENKIIEIAKFSEQFDNPEILAKPEVVLKT